MYGNWQLCSVRASRDDVENVKYRGFLKENEIAEIRKKYV